MVVDSVPNLNVHNRAEALYIDVLKLCKQAKFPAALANMNNLAYSNALRETSSQPVFNRGFVIEWLPADMISSSFASLQYRLRILGPFSR